MLSTVSSQQTQCLPLVSVACGAILTAGIWWSLTTAQTTSSAYVQVQSASGVKVAMLPVQKSRQMYTPSTLVERDASASATPSTLAAQPSMITNVAIAASPLLAIVAVLIALVRVPFLKRRTIPAPDSYYSMAAVTPSEDASPARTLVSPRIDEVARALTAEQASRKTLSPKQVILELQRGNARFWSGTPERPELNAMERRALIIAQAPSVCILSCSDSRVPVEIVFDQGLGSVFVVRVAGNIVDSSAIGSIEFSIKYLGVKVLLVMGHEACGAVKGAFGMTNEELDAQPPYLQAVLRTIKSNLDLDQLSNIRDVRAKDREAIVVNATSQIKKLQENPLIAGKVADGSLMVCGAFYEITSGIVDFFTLDKNGLVTDI